jgi:hypothetical protein
VLGPATLGLGIGLAIGEASAASRYLRTNLEGFFSGRMEAAKAASAAGTRTPKAELVITDPPGLPVSVGGGPIRSSPVVVLGVTGAAAKVRSADGWLGELSGRLDAGGGSPVLFLRDESTGEPLGPSWVRVEKLAGRRHGVSWAAVPGAKRFSLEIDRAGGDFSTPLEIRHGLKGERFVHAAPRDVQGELAARVCAFDKSGTRSRWSDINAPTINAQASAPVPQPAAPATGAPRWLFPVGAGIFGVPALGPPDPYAVRLVPGAVAGIHLGGKTPLYWGLTVFVPVAIAPTLPAFPIPELSLIVRSPQTRVSHWIGALPIVISSSWIAIALGYGLGVRDVAVLATGAWWHTLSVPRMERWHFAIVATYILSGGRGP